MNLKAGVSSVFVCAFLLASAPAHAVESAPAKSVLEAARELENAYIQTIKNVLPAYVFLEGGSGVLISSDGYFLTNHHVIRNKKSALVRSGGKDYDAKTIGIDTRGDIALLKMDNVSNMPFLEFADSDALRIGQQVFAIGNPFNTAEVTDDPTVTTGIISALHRFEANYTDAIQTDAAVNPGNSGGPLVTLDGKLAGINGLIETKFGNSANTGVALAIPAKQIERFLPKLKAAHGKTVQHGSIIGLNPGLQDELAKASTSASTPDGVRNGAIVKTIAPNTSAEKLGLKPGDKILKIDNYSLLNYFRFLGVINTYPAGSQIKLTYERNGEQKTVLATLEDSSPGRFGIEMQLPDARRGARFTKPKILAVDPNSPALKGGLKSGDEILTIQGNFMSSLAEVRLYMTREIFAAGDIIKFKVRRGTLENSEEAELSVTVPSATETAKAK